MAGNIFLPTQLIRRSLPSYICDKMAANASPEASVNTMNSGIFPSLVSNWGNALMGGDINFYFIIWKLRRHSSVHINGTSFCVKSVRHVLYLLKLGINFL